MKQQSTGEQRVIIRANVKSIPGDPLARPFALGELYSQQVLHRSLRESGPGDEPDDEQSPVGFDAVHLLPGFDSPNPIQGWFVFDIDVRREMGKKNICTLPHYNYSAQFDDDKREWVFTPRPVSEKLVHYLSLYQWGAGELQVHQEGHPQVQTLGT
ncbi:uncharacterized protein LTR77_007541 [Saxophila tyrrhenica]|uniref:Uncharacterized protein n=1 Tax=Saxophila tyrrhenica TaxID=1690608 RepID=A0AAV9P7Y9_9PEZI|nr:hypothetical protein LTR77_007541 [Saxophila tyrrhenica]